jgi:hypothetical protein
VKRGPSSDDKRAGVERAQVLAERAQLVRSFDGYDDSSDLPVALRATERAYLTVTGVALVEPRRGPGSWKGANQGVSVKVPGTKSMRYRVGQTRGTYEQGEERPTPIDTGTFTLTTTRAVFVGEKQTREWLWSKLLGVVHDSRHPWSSIAVSNRQKTSGVLYDDNNADTIRFWIDLAVARATGRTDQMAAELDAQRQALLPEPPSNPAAWAVDPFGRFELRWWDGKQWTDQVSTGGLVAIDPPSWT